jgi:hypothetical protein
MSDRTRVYKLAHDLDVESKRIMAVCQKLGFDVKNLLSSLSMDERRAIEKAIERDDSDGSAGILAPLRRPPSTGQAASGLQL